MGISYLEWFGYLATAIIALSMAMSSIARFRAINLVGATMLAIYGFMISSMPVGILNTFIALVDIYFLAIIYSRKERFEILSTTTDNSYLIRFLEFFKHDIERFIPGFVFRPDEVSHAYFILRDMNVAGVFLAKMEEGHTLHIKLDYVTPSYRDYKNGKYLINSIRHILPDGRNTSLIATGITRKHKRYLEKMGFRQVAGKSDLFILK